MKSFQILQIIVSVILTVAVLLQSRGEGLGVAFGGDLGSYHTKRGVEKFLVRFTVVMAIIFTALAVLHIVIF